jgi:hypothetical protein
VGGQGDRDGVVGVALAAVAGRQQPHPGGQLGGRVEDWFTLADQLLGEGAAKAAGPSTAQRRSGQRLAQRPSAYEPVRVLANRCWSTSSPRSSSTAAVQLALWGSTPMITPIPRPPW